MPGYSAISARSPGALPHYAPTEPARASACEAAPAPATMLHMLPPSKPPTPGALGHPFFKAPNANDSAWRTQATALQGTRSVPLHRGDVATTPAGFKAEQGAVYAEATLAEEQDGTRVHVWLKAGETDHLLTLDPSEAEAMGFLRDGKPVAAEELEAIRYFVEELQSGKSHQALAEDPTTPSDVLGEMWEALADKCLEFGWDDRSVALGQAIAGNPNLPSSIALNVASYFPGRILKNPALPLMVLAEKPSFFREASAETIEQMVLDLDPGQTKFPVPQLLDALAESEQPRMYHAKNWIAYETDHPQVIAVLAKDGRTATRCGIAGNPNASAEILAALARDRDPDVRAAAARNPHTPLPSLLSLLGDAESKIREAALENPGLWANRRRLAESADTPPVVLDLLVVHHLRSVEAGADKGAPARDPGVLERVAANPNTPEDTLWVLAKCSSASVREAVAANTSVPRDLILWLFVRDGEPSVRRSAAANPNASQAELDALAKDAHASVRLAVAEHPKTSLRTKLKLRFFDDEKTVRDAASRRLGF